MQTTSVRLTADQSNSAELFWHCEIHFQTGSSWQRLSPARQIQTLQRSTKIMFLAQGEAQRTAQGETSDLEEFAECNLRDNTVVPRFFSGKQQHLDL